MKNKAFFYSFLSALMVLNIVILIAHTVEAQVKNEFSMRITEQGFVGIGTSNPVGRFQVDQRGDSNCNGSACSTKVDDDLILKNGNVGIGVIPDNDSDKKLQVGGKILTTGGVVFPDGQVQTVAYDPNKTSLWSQVLGSNNIYYQNGKVGIGLNNPEYSLDVYMEDDSREYAPVARFINKDNNKLRGYYLMIPTEEKQGGYSIGGVRMIGDTGYFTFENSDGKRQFTVNTRTGNVSVGGLTASQKLDVNGSSIVDSMYIRPTSSDLVPQCEEKNRGLIILNPSPDSGNDVLSLCRKEGEKYKWREIKTGAVDL